MFWTSVLHKFSYNAFLANCAHCVARMNILYAVFNSEILCSHICENPRIRLGPFLGVNNHIIHVYSYILLTIHLM